MPTRRCAPLVLALAGALSPLAGPGSAAGGFDGVADLMTTGERLRSHPWWPRKTLADRDGYAGSAACGACHGSILERQRTTAMARTLAPADPSHLEATGGAGTFELGPYRYRIAAEEGEGLGFTVSDDSRTLSAPIEWVFGAGTTGYTYAWEREGVFYESRFSYFPTLGRLAATPGRLLGLPDSLEMALGHPLSDKEARGCFSCHASAMVAADGLDTRRLTPGVTCEGCHGPGADHVALERSGLTGAGAVFAPGRLGPGALADFCGACHGTFWDVAVGPSTGLATVRSPGYRLARSRCWGRGDDARLSCLACHDPHGDLEHEPAAYDGACSACHERGGGAGTGADGTGGGGSGQGPAPCPVGTAGCVSCHMPKVELPEVHVRSTDHWIRVVRPGEPFPD